MAHLYMSDGNVHEVDMTPDELVTKLVVGEHEARTSDTPKNGHWLRAVNGWLNTDHITCITDGTEPTSMSDLMDLIYGAKKQKAGDDE